jgi:hypothetical protein
VSAAWRWRRFGPLAGMVLVLIPCWLLVGIVGPPPPQDEDNRKRVDGSHSIPPMPARSPSISLSRSPRFSSAMPPRPSAWDSHSPAPPTLRG